LLKNSEVLKVMNKMKELSKLFKQILNYPPDRSPVGVKVELGTGAKMKMEARATSSHMRLR
jgi:hypothetical protein